MTLVEVLLLLLDEGFRQKLVGKLDDPVSLEPMWGWFASLSPSERSAVVSPVINKIRAFSSRRPIRNVIGQSRSSFTMEEVLADRRILLVSLAKGLARIRLRCLTPCC